MKFIDKLERKFGRFGITNLTMYMIVTYAIGYGILMLRPELLSVLSLEPALILKGQVWRLFTWVFYPPDGGGNLFLFILMLAFFYYPIGNSLERTWGSFRYTLYIFSGLVFTILGAFILYFIMGPNVRMGGLFSTYYISTSIFLAYAVSYPNLTLLLMFVIPVKMSWMAVLYGVLIAWDVVTCVRTGQWYLAVPIVASLLNFLIYFFSIRDMSRYNPREIRRKQEFRKAMQPQGRVNPKAGGIAKHRCAVCGRTEQDNPDLEFRFCSKCKGNYEYCQDHLFTHTHVK